MKVYPKIPRYDHPVVPESFFDADDLVLLEKFDGSSFRFTLYDERYASSYPDPVVAAAEGDGSLVSERGALSGAVIATISRTSTGHSTGPSVVFATGSMRMPSVDVTTTIVAP